MREYDVVHETGSTQRITAPSEEDRATAIGKTVKVAHARLASVEFRS